MTVDLVRVLRRQQALEELALDMSIRPFPALPADVRLDRVAGVVPPMYRRPGGSWSASDDPADGWGFTFPGGIRYHTGSSRRVSSVRPPRPLPHA